MDKVQKSNFRHYNAPSSETFKSGFHRSVEHCYNKWTHFMWSQKNYYDGTSMEYQLNVMVKKITSSYLIYLTPCHCNYLSYLLMLFPFKASTHSGCCRHGSVSPCPNWPFFPSPQLYTSISVNKHNSITI